MDWHVVQDGAANIDWVTAFGFLDGLDSEEAFSFRLSMLWGVTSGGKRPLEVVPLHSGSGWRN